jgi:hypothetical protein
MAIEQNGDLERPPGQVVLGIDARQGHFAERVVDRRDPGDGVAELGVKCGEAVLRQLADAGPGWVRP